MKKLTADKKLENLLEVNNIKYDFLQIDEYHEGYEEVYYYYIPLEESVKLNLKPYKILETNKIAIIRLFESDIY